MCFSVFTWPHVSTRLWTYFSLKQFRSRSVLNPPSKTASDKTLSPRSGHNSTGEHYYRPKRVHEVNVAKSWGKLWRQGKTAIRRDVMVMGGRADEGLRLYVRTVDSGGRKPMPDLSCCYGNYPTNYPGRIPLVLQTLSGQPLRP